LTASRAPEFAETTVLWAQGDVTHVPGTLEKDWPLNYGFGVEAFSLAHEFGGLECVLIVNTSFPMNTQPPEEHLTGGHRCSQHTGMLAEANEKITLNSCPGWSR